jgi:predicted Holliday junction resolvase-like endonuclease
VKVLFDPIEFVAFRGMCDGGVKAVSLIDRPAAGKDRERLQESVRRTVGKGNYEWTELRIDAEGRVSET